MNAANVESKEGKVSRVLPLESKIKKMHQWQERKNGGKNERIRDLSLLEPLKLGKEGERAGIGLPRKHYGRGAVWFAFQKRRCRFPFEGKEKVG